MTAKNYQPGPINVEGFAIDDFLLTDKLPPDKAPATIEIDRLNMAARPGFNRKLLPLSVEQDTGKIYSGGRYLFDTYENAKAFGDWCSNKYELDGVLILERQDFADVSAGVHRVIGAYDFKDVHSSQVACRTEVWDSNEIKTEDILSKLWPQLRDRAAEEGKSALWLMHDPEANRVIQVSVFDRVGNYSEQELDYQTLAAVEQSSSYGSDWKWAEKTFDRSHWVFTIWFPNTGDASDKLPLWPNSPPLPAPSDAVRSRSAA
ncbi:MAG: hypothetical protein GKR93_00200 [Gammaproteobacteria bacterium]|nr:hypothetical protein [Gammaproteobacteria bacterium]